MNSSSSLWSQALETISQRVNPHVLETYFEPIRCLEESPEKLRLALPNKFLRDWVAHSYQAFIQDIVEESSGQQTEIEFTVDVVGQRVPRAEVSTLRAPRRKEAALRREADGAALGTAPAAGPSRTHRHLNEKYTFANFVCGDSNQFANAACKAVADHPGLNYNPLFLFGGTGLGKTHLLHAIGLEIKRRHPDWNVIPLSAETFTNEVIQSIRENRMDSLRKSYREQCDVLLMDDIQFLAGKDRTQEEFFHTFNSLHETGRQIVVTSDKYPNEIPDLEERLASRFQWGLIADIQPPELETRVAILEKKASLDGINLPEDVSMFLATHVKKNVRELEGALVRVEAFASITGQEISVELARQALKDRLAPEGRPPDADRIIKTVAGFFNLKVSDLCSDRRHKAVSQPRQIAMYLVRDLTSLSFPDIGRRFGGKDHSTVISACKKVKRLLETDASIRQSIEYIVRDLTP
ncbi:MAG: chromosomal replication initiator protein DnaA [Myxococcota bacterium]